MTFCLIHSLFKIRYNGESGIGGRGRTMVLCNFKSEAPTNLNSVREGLTVFAVGTD